MTFRPALLATIAAALATAPTATAGAQSGDGPQPLWVPDPKAIVEPRPQPSPAAVDVVSPAALVAPVADDPTQVAIAHWMAAEARAAGLPGELPVMAALVESGLRNLPYGDRDSVGFFQMRLGIWDRGPYAGYLARPELQVRWFVEHALAVRAARRAAGDARYGADSRDWGEWIADVERPARPYRARYAQRLDQARALLAQTPPTVAPFELGLTVGGAATPGFGAAAAELARRVIDDANIELDERARRDLRAGRIDPRLSAVLLEAAARAPIVVTVLQTGHSYLTVHGTVSNHSFGRGADIGAVGGKPVRRGNAAARALALALGDLPADLRPTEIGTPWAIDEPGYFTDGGHQDHLHVAFDDVTTIATPTVSVAARKKARKPAPTPRRPGTEPAEPRFRAGGRSGRGAEGEPRFKVNGGSR